MATKQDILHTHLQSWMQARGNKKARSELLKHVCFVTGMHPKSVPRAFKREQLRDSPGMKGAGRPVVFGADVTAALYDIWEAANYCCGELLHSNIPEFVSILQRDGQWNHTAEATNKLLLVKEHTVRRRVSALRTKHHGDKGLSGTKPSALKSIIPIFKGPWSDLPPGNGQLDTVAHCGSSLAGDFIWSLNYTDISTYWIITRAQWNKGQRATLDNMEFVKNTLPFPWLMGHPDSGSEFINWLAKEWFDRNNILLTRSQPNRKNDNMCVEERNGHVIRKYLGYMRFDTRDLVDELNEFYATLNLYLNHFIVVRRTEEKKRVGAKYVRRYERKPQTPYRRVLAHSAVSNETKERLMAIHETLNPLTLKRQLDTMILKIFKLQRGNHETEREGGLR
jgi:hypothetical protein